MRRAVVALLIVTAALAAAQRPAAPADEWELVVLGIAQDAGIPQLGCTQALCESIRAGKRHRERVASLGFINRARHKTYLIDATPDFVSQLESANALRGPGLPDAIFLTHGHIGHYTGLMYLGRESIDAKSVPVYGTARMTTFLEKNGPWSLLVERKNIALKTLTPDAPVATGDGLTFTPILVPHRDEFTDTVGYIVSGPHKKVLYIPDIDQWQKWGRSIRDVVAGVDVAFLDGTFASADEVPGRSIADIPHPLIPTTRELLRGLGTKVWFIHLNHTNLQIDAQDVARDGLTFLM